MDGITSSQEWHGRDSRQACSTPLKTYQEMMVKSMLGTSRVNEALHAVVENVMAETALSETDSSVLERNRALLQYVSTLANSNHKDDAFNYEFVQSLLDGGADINISDQNGQTMFHEVARSWNIDVARFLLLRGALQNKQDNFGRSPLHVAVSVDFVEMTEFLLQNDADMDARTVGDRQAPIHYAAKSGAELSLKMLLGYQAEIDSLDYMQRTPLQLAAIWTRAKTAKVLIDEGAASCLLDSSGNSALSVLIDRLPQLALEALNQLHSTDTITKKEFYYLNLLEASRMKVETKKLRTPLEMAVETRKYDVITHPVMRRLIHSKWIQFGRFSTIMDLFFYIIFNIMWTAMSVITPGEGNMLYRPLNENIWRVVLLSLIGILIIYQVVGQARATMKTIKAQTYWVEFQTNELEQDLQHCHPRWPQEEKTVRSEIKRISKFKKSLGADAWFYYDWVVLVVMVAAIASHFIYYKVDTNAARYVYTRILSIANLLVWLRLMKYVRPFPGIGTLVIILGGAIGDFVNWAFLFFLLLVPFAASFWIIFGGISTHPVRGFKGTQSLLYSVFRMAVGDDFNFEGLAEADPVMARILTVMYITVTTIVTLNLLIALLSETFSRVYNNAVANTIMQRAIKVIAAERALSKKRKLNYQEHVKVNCSPDTVKSVVKPGPSGHTLKGTTEFNSNLVNLKKVLDDRFAKAYGKDNISDFDKIQDDIRDLSKSQKHLFQELGVIMKLMKGLKGDKTTQNGSEKSEERRLAKLIKFVQNDKDSEKRRGKSKERKEKDKRGKTDKSGKTNKRNAKNRSPGKSESGKNSRNTSIVPYGHFGGNQNDSEEDKVYDNASFEEDRIGASNDWETVSVDSLSL